MFGAEQVKGRRDCPAARQAPLLGLLGPDTCVSLVEGVRYVCRILNFRTAARIRQRRAKGRVLCAMQGAKQNEGRTSTLQNSSRDAPTLRACTRCLHGRLSTSPRFESQNTPKLLLATRPTQLSCLPSTTFSRSVKQQLVPAQSLPSPLLSDNLKVSPSLSAGTGAAQTGPNLQLSFPLYPQSFASPCPTRSLPPSSRTKPSTAPSPVSSSPSYLPSRLPDPLDPHQQPTVPK